MKKAYFQYYESFEIVVQKIKNEEERNHFRLVIIEYGLYGSEPEELSEIEEIAWVIVKELIDQQRNRREINANNRKKTPGREPEAAAVKNEEPEKETAAKKKTTDEKKPRFRKPTVDEVKAFCKEKGYHVDAASFVSYYESNGWRVGKNPMKSWQAAVITWNARDGNNGKETAWSEEEKKVSMDYADYF